MENEENIGLIDKKDFKDQWERYTYALTQSFLRELLEECVILWIWRKKEKERQESASGHQDQRLQLDCFAGIELHVWFPSQFWNS